MINLLVTNLLSSILLVPLLLVDQDTNRTNQNPLDLEQFINLTTEVDLKNASLSDSSIPSSEDFVFQEAQISNQEILYEKDELIIKSNNSELKIVQNSEILSNISYVAGEREEEFGEWLCYLAQCSTSLVCTTSIFSILLIGIDQYFAVIHSLRYHSYINKFRSLILISAGWMLSVLFAVLGALTQTDSNFWKFCNQTRIFTSSSDTIKTLSTLYAFAYFFIVIIFPFVAICAIYVCIYKAAHRNSERMRQSTSGSSTCNLDSYVQLATKTNEPKLPKVHSAPNFVTFQTETETEFTAPATTDDNTLKVTRTCSERTSNNFINNIKCKISNASIFKYREESRAAKISLLVIFMVLICYIPYGLALISNSEIFDVTSNRTFNYISLLLLVFSNIISPFLFAYRNRRIQRELYKFFGVVPPRNSRLNSMRSYYRNSVRRNNTHSNLEEACEKNEQRRDQEPFLQVNIPTVIVTCKVDVEKKSILKRVCSKNWPNYKKCNFITVPDSCVSGEARGSFSSASTQISSEE